MGHPTFEPRSGSDRNPPLRLSDRFSYIVQGDELAILVGDEDAVLVDHPQAARVVSLLDGLRTATEIADALADGARPEVTHFSLICLERAGIVEPLRDDARGCHEARQAYSSPSGSIAQQLRNAWERRGASPIAITELDGAPGVGVILARDYLADCVLDAVRADVSRPVVLLRLGRRSAWVGPCLFPGRSPCIACLRERLQFNLTAHAFVHAHGVEPEVRISPLPGAPDQRVFQWAAEGLVDVLPWEEGNANDAAIEVRDARGVSSRHVVSRLPDCKLCGDPSVTVAGPNVEVRSAPRGAQTLAGYRTRPLQETLDRYAGLISPLTGVVRRLRRIPLDLPEAGLVHVYTASHPLEYRGASVRAIREDRRDHSGGKGRTDLEANVSALCESLERFSSIHRGSEPVRRARLSELGPGALAPNDIMLFSERQLRVREEWNRAQAGDFQHIPEPYTDQLIEWCGLRSLGTGGVVFAPASLVFLGFQGESAAFAKGDSNGLAGGNCLEEAILQAFLELVERDAVAIWWYNRPGRPGIDLASFEDPYLRQIEELYGSLGRSLWALDLTTDLGIPCVAAISHVPDAPHEDIIFGFGAHLDASIALSRAITELNQMLPAIQRSREERRRQLLPDFRDAIEWWDRARVGDETYLLPTKAGPSAIRDALPGEGCDDLRECILHCVERARSVGSDLLVYDLTRADVGFPVVRVIAPGLRHFWRRLAPGRLYDVPVRMGWHAHPIAEEDMNPASVFV